MYCNKCGSELSDNSAFCMFCGANLKDLNQKKPEGEQETAVESAQELMEKEIEQSIPPIMQMQSDVMTAAQASAEIAQLGRVLEQALKEKHEEKDKKWVRIRVDKNERSKLKKRMIGGWLAFIFLIFFLGFICWWAIQDLGMVAAVCFSLCIAPGLICMVWRNYTLKQINLSDLYVSNVRCYGIDIHAGTVSFLLNDIVRIERKQPWSIKRHNSSSLGFLSLCTTGREYIFASRDIDVVFAAFSQYLSEREKNR